MIALCNRNRSVVLENIYIHTQVALDGRVMMTDTHTYLYPCPRLIACTNTYFSFSSTGAFPLHAIGVTRNLRTYFTSVRRVFLVETVVLQTTVRHPGVERPFSS